MANIVWTQEMTNIAVGMKRAGFSAKAIARRLAISHRSVEGRLRRLNVRKNLDGRDQARPKGGRILNSCLSPIIEEE